MRLLWRLLIAVASFALAGYATMHGVIAHAVARGVPEYQVRLAGAMAGLFVGGVAACLVGLALIFLGRGRKPPGRDRAP